jgi:hypothetical protein
MPKASLTASDVAVFGQLASVDDAATFLGTSRRRLFFHLYDRKRPGYRSFSIRKASGGHRQISAPPKVLAAFQRRLLLAFDAVAPSKPHVGSRLVLNFDLLNFFPSIHFGRVVGLFRSHPFDFPNSVAALLAQICCVAKVLPQGAPTSPAISNLICRGMTGISLRSRECIVVASHSFQPNDRKTRFRTQRDRQEVTGLRCKYEGQRPERVYTKHQIGSARLREARRRGCRRAVSQRYRSEDSIWRASTARVASFGKARIPSDGERSK